VLTASFTRIFAAALLILGTDAAAITFDDGLVHVIDAGNSFPSESVTVQDGPGAATTTVTMVDGEVGTTTSGDLVAREGISNSSCIFGNVR
jgi:hypothetical protein